MSLPSGTLTFLFTDVEGSTRLWERDAESMRESLLEHDRIIQEAVSRHGGSVFKKMGDAVCAVFVRADAAVAAALHAQSALRATPEAPRTTLPVRMALYTGFARESEGDYLGPPLNRTARLLSASHGGQILLSEATRDLARDALPSGASVLDLGFHSLKDLERSERAFQLVHPSIPSGFPPLRSLSAFKHNLPIQLTALVGREQEIRTVEALIENHRLVTLYGSGGCGKTRLSLQVGAEVVDRFPDGVWLVELGTVADAAQAEQALASALGLREEGQQDIRQVIIQHLRDKRALLILDNCEHLVEACARQAVELLRSCPEIKIVATSREVLSVHGEVTWRVPSLPIPALKKSFAPDDVSQLLRNDSVRLFAERAAEGAPGFALGTDNAESVAWIAWRLDGIPLALELAAARVKTLTVEHIRERLREHFAILVGPRTALPRHKTLEATMDWSYLLLEERERALLSRLTIFAGGWTIESAESICLPRKPSDSDPFSPEEIMDLLARLQDKSLICADWSGNLVCFHMLQMVREYAAAHLPEEETEALRRRHLEFFLGLAEESVVHIPGANQAEWLRHLDREQENLRAALDFAKQQLDLCESGLRLAGALARYWHIRGFFSEGRRHLTALLGLAPKKSVSQGLAAAHNGLGILAWSQGDLAVARSSYEESLRLWRELGNEHQIAWVLSNLGLVSMDQQRFKEARGQFEQSLAIRRALGDTTGEALSLMNLGILARHEERYAESGALYADSLGLFRQLGDAGGEAKVLTNLVDVLYQQGDTETAVQMQEDSLALFEQLGDKRGCAFALRNLGDVWRAQNCPSHSLENYVAAVRLSRQIGLPFVLIRSLQGIAKLGMEHGFLKEAACILGATHAIERQSPGASSAGPEQGTFGTIDPHDFNDNRAKGEAMTGEEIEEFIRRLSWFPPTQDGGMAAPRRNQKGTDKQKL